MTHFHSQFDPMSLLETSKHHEQVDGERIRLARESRGITQLELSKRVGVSNALVSRWELNQSNPEADILEISKALDYPVTYFSYSPIFTPSILSHNYRTTSKMSIKDKKCVEASAYIRMDQISQIINRWADFSWGVPEYDPDLDSPEKIANKVRYEFNISRGPINDITRLLESRGIFVFIEKFEDSSLDAITVNQRNGTPPTIFVNSERPGERIRFTLAHELGHLVMHRLPRVDMEKEADRFASEFLMPADDICSDFHSNDLSHYFSLKRYWKVSIQSLLYKASSLELISKQEYQKFCIIISKKGWKKNEPSPLSIEVPNLAKTLIQHIMKATGISADEIAHIIGSSKDDFLRNFLQQRTSQFKLIEGGKA